MLVSARIPLISQRSLVQFQPAQPPKSIREVAPIPQRVSAISYRGYPYGIGESCSSLRSQRRFAPWPCPERKIRVFSRLFRITSPERRRGGCA